MIPSQMLKGGAPGQRPWPSSASRRPMGMQSSRPWRPTASAPSPRGRCTPPSAAGKGGLIQARFRDSALGPRRKYYALTEQGREELAQFHASFRPWPLRWPAAWLCPGKGGDPMNPTVRKLFAAEQRPGKGPLPQRAKAGDDRRGGLPPGAGPQPPGPGGDPPGHPGDGPGRGGPGARPCSRSSAWTTAPSATRSWRRCPGGPGGADALGGGRHAPLPSPCSWPSGRPRRSSQPC